MTHRTARPRTLSLLAAAAALVLTGCPKPNPAALADPDVEFDVDPNDDGSACEGDECDAPPPDDGDDADLCVGPDCDDEIDTLDDDPEADGDDRTEPEPEPDADEDAADPDDNDCPIGPDECTATPGTLFDPASCRCRPACEVEGTCEDEDEEPEPDPDTCPIGPDDCLASSGFVFVRDLCRCVLSCELEGNCEEEEEVRCPAFTPTAGASCDPLRPVCAEGTYCDPLLRVCGFECTADDCCTERFGDGFTCNKARGRCEPPCLDCEELPPADEELDPAPGDADDDEARVCCTGNEQCRTALGRAAVCAAGADPSCGDCRPVQCTRDTDCIVGGVLLSCDTTRFECLVPEEDEPEADEEAARTGRAAGTIFVGPDITAAVEVVEFELYVGPVPGAANPALYRTQAALESAGRWTFRLTGIAQGSYYGFAVVRTADSRETRQGATDGQPIRVFETGAGARLDWTGLTYYLGGACDPAKGSISGRVLVETADLNRAMEVRVVDESPVRGLPPTYVARTFPPAASGSPSRREFSFCNLPAGGYWLVAFFSDAPDLYDDSNLPIDLSYDRGGPRDAPGEQLSLLACRPELGTLAGRVRVTSGPMRAKTPRLRAYSGAAGTSAFAAVTVPALAADGTASFRQCNLTPVPAPGGYTLRVEYDLADEPGKAALGAPTPAHTALCGTAPTPLAAGQTVSNIDCAVGLLDGPRSVIFGTVTFDGPFTDTPKYAELWEGTPGSGNLQQIVPLTMTGATAGTYAFAGMPAGTYNVSGVSYFDRIPPGQTTAVREVVRGASSRNPIVIPAGGNPVDIQADASVVYVDLFGSISGIVRVRADRVTGPRVVWITAEPYRTGVVPAAIARETGEVTCPAFDDPCPGAVADTTPVRCFGYTAGPLATGAYYGVAFIDADGNGTPGAAELQAGQPAAPQIVLAGGPVDLRVYKDVPYVLGVPDPRLGRITGRVFVNQGAASKVQSVIKLFVYDGRGAVGGPDLPPVRGPIALTVDDTNEWSAPFEVRDLPAGEEYSLEFWIDEENDGSRRNNFVRRTKRGSEYAVVPSNFPSCDRRVYTNVRTTVGEIDDLNPTNAFYGKVHVAAGYGAEPAAAADDALEVIVGYNDTSQRRPFSDPIYSTTVGNWNATERTFEYYLDELPQLPPPGSSLFAAIRFANAGRRFRTAFDHRNNPLFITAVEPQRVESIVAGAGSASFNVFGSFTAIDQSTKPRISGSIDVDLNDATRMFLVGVFTLPLNLDYLAELRDTYLAGPATPEGLQAYSDYVASIEARLVTLAEPLRRQVLSDRVRLFFDDYLVPLNDRTAVVYFLGFGCNDNLLSIYPVIPEQSVYCPRPGGVEATSCSFKLGGSGNPISVTGLTAPTTVAGERRFLGYDAWTCPPAPSVSQ